MRITLDIDEKLLTSAKQQAIQQGSSLKQAVEEALREFFPAKTKAENEIPSSWKQCPAGTPLGNQCFKQQIAAATGVAVGFNKRGRPLKKNLQV